MTGTVMTAICNSVKPGHIIMIKDDMIVYSGSVKEAPIGVSEDCLVIMNEAEFEDLKAFTKHLRGSPN